MALSLLNPVLVMAAPSFDCAKAQTIVENSICDDEKLGKLDEMLSANYKAVMAVAKATDVASAEKVKRDQKEWMQERDQCTDINCITVAYVDRVNGICERAMIAGLDVEDCTKFNPDEGLSEESPPPQPAVSQQLPLEVRWESGYLYLTATADAVTVNKITVNRGNCKTYDLKEERNKAAREIAQYPNKKGELYYRGAIHTGILKFGETERFITVITCNPRELIIDTDQGSWTVTLQ